LKSCIIISCTKRRSLKIDYDLITFSISKEEGGFMKNYTRVKPFSLAALSIVLMALFAFAAINGCVPAYDFSIAVIADPHCTGGQEHWDRLDSAVNWVNENKDAKKIELVVLVGDMAWGGSYLSNIRQRLEGLTMPYLPVIGDNEVNAGDEATFNTVFSSHFDYLASLFGDSWAKSPVPVLDPRTGQHLYLQNYSFDYKGLHIMCTDWGTRNPGPGLESEQAELFDFEGGTWPWFKQDMESSIGEAQNNILVFSHHPMHVSPVYPLIRADLGAFSVNDFKTITNFTLPFKDYFYANYAGHYHVPWYQDVSQGGYKLYVVRSLHQPSQLANTQMLEEPTLELINVTRKGSVFSYKNLLAFLNQTGKELILEDNRINDKALMNLIP
jgi:hypothetical protein